MQTHPMRICVAQSDLCQSDSDNPAQQRRRGERHVHWEPPSVQTEAPGDARKEDRDRYKQHGRQGAHDGVSEQDVVLGKSGIVVVMVRLASGPHCEDARRDLAPASWRTWTLYMPL